MSVKRAVPGQKAPEQEPGQQGDVEEQQEPGTLGLLSDDDDEDEQDDEGEEPEPSTPMLTAQDVESAIDRRINAVLREIRQDRGQTSRGRGQQQAGGSSNRTEQQTPAGPSREDMREARAAYREFVADEVRFLGNEERDFARAVAEARIRAGIARGDDPDDVGRDVAAEVAAEVKGLREFYEARVVSALKRKGLLPATTGSKQQAGQKVTPTGQAGSSWSKGESRAKSLFADRFQQ